MRMRVHPPSLFWIEDRLDESMMTYLWSQINLANKDYKNNLVGHISSSLELPDEEQKLSNYTLEVAKELDYLYTPDLKMGTSWVNFQKKYEFNPVHMHDGKMSYVIWMKIPYSYEEEAKRAPAINTSHSVAGCFEFIYTDMLGQIAKMTYTAQEGTLVVFPAALFHVVYPFYTSNEERISISGNIL